MRNFLQNLKNGLVSIQLGRSLDSLLSRFCLASLILMTIGISQAWGNTATLSAKSTSVKKDDITFSLGGSYIEWNPAVDYTYTASGYEATLSWSVPTGYTINVSQISIYAKNAKSFGKTGKGQYKTSKNSSYTQFCNSNSWNTYPLNSSSYFGLGNSGSITIKAVDRELQYKDIVFTYTKTAHKYTITFNGNGSTSGSTASVGATYDQNVTLTKNGFEKRKYTVTYSSPDGGNLAKSTDPINYTFLGWAKSASGNKEYVDEQTLVKPNFTSTDGGSYPLYAKWGDPASTTVTLPNVVKSGYVLEGWYDGTTKVGEAGQTYTVTKNVTLVANLTQKFDPEFPAAASFNLMVDGEQTNAFTFKHAPNPVAHITIKSISGVKKGDQVISYDTTNNKIIAHNAGVAEIYFTQEATTTNNQGTSAKYTYTISKYETSITGSAYNLMVDGEQTADYTYTNTSADKPTANSSDNFYYTVDLTAYTKETLNQSGGFVTFNPSNKKIMAKNAGTGKITLRQKETYKYTGDTVSFNVAVYKYNSAFSNAANFGVKVEEPKEASYTLTYSKPNNAYIGTIPVAGDPSLNSGDYYYTLTQNVTSDNTTGSADSDIAVVYNAGTKTATGKNAGTCTVKLYQKENYKFKADSTNFTVTVTKNDPTFTWKAGPYYHNTTVNSVFSSSNKELDYTIGASTDAQVAYESGNTLYVLSKNGTASFTVTQETNYKWNGKAQTYSVTPQNPSNHVPFTVSNSNYTTFKTLSSSNVSWSNPGFRLCDGGWSTLDDYFIIAFTGVPDKLTFDRVLDKWGASLPGTYECHVYASADGSNWGNAIWTLNERSENASANVQVPATARYLKFTYHGTVYCHYNNIKVTELKKFTPSETTLDFGALDINTTGSATQKTFDFNYANVGHNVTLSTDDSHFTVSPTSITNIGGEKTGKVTITVNYSTTAQHKATNAKLTITDELGNNTNVTLKGETKKLTPTINWSPDASIFNVEDVLSATNANGLTVTLSVEAADADYVACSGNTATMINTKSGTVTIKAHVTGDEIYEDADFTRDVTITNKTKQSISWDQDFSRRKTTDATKSITLTATASSNLPVTYKLEGDATGLTLTQNGNTWILTYSASECKNTTIVAMQDGNDEYAPAPNFSLPVKVIDPTKECDVTTVLVNSNIELKSADQSINLEIPNEITIHVKRTNTEWYAASLYSNGFKVEFYDQKNGTGNKVGDTYSYSKDEINTSKTITIKNLDRKIKSVKLISEALLGYTVTNVAYEQQKYCEASESALNFATYPNTTTSAKTFTVNYANYPISLECANSKFTVSPKDFGDCGEKGTQTVSVTYTAGAEEGTDNGNILYIKDNTGKTLATCTLNVSISKVAQNINNHNIASTYNTTDRVELTAETNSSAAEKHFTYSATPAGVASFDGNVMTFLQSGTIDIIVREAGSDVYKPCADTVKNVVVNKVTPTLTLPTGTNVTYLQNLSTSTLSGGKATVTLRGVENTEVEGAFTWTNGSAQTNGAAGSNSYEVTFTPEDEGMYNPATGMVTITVDKANQSIVMNNGTVSVAVDKGLDANSDDSKLNLTSLIALQTADALDATRTGAVSFEVISENSTNATISGTIFSATAEGTYTVRATKAVTNYYNAATTEFTVTANVRTNSMSIAGACTRYVDQEVTNVLSNVNSDAEIHTSSSDASIAYYDINTNKIVIPNSEAKSFNDTTVTITIWQEATTQFEASGEKTIKVTVKKYDNALTCDWGTWSKILKFDEGTYVHFSSNNTDLVKAPITIEQVTGLENATYYPATHAIYASHNIGDATWRVSQAETYLYKAAPAKTLTVKIDTIPMPTDCYVLNETTEVDLFGVLGVGTGDPLELSAPGKNLYFDAKRDAAGVNYFFIEYSTNGSQYKVLGNEVQLSPSYETYGPYELPEGTTHIRFKTTTGATLTKHYKNVHVTRKTAFDLEDKGGAKISTMEMPLNIVSIDPLNVNSSKKSFWVDFNTCADVINVASNHPYYTVKEADKAFNASATNGAGRREIEVTYTCATADSSSAVISVYTQYEHRTITVKGRTDKGTQEILWKEPDFVNDTVSLPVGYSGTAGTTTSKLPLKYSIDSLHSDTGVICIANDEYSFEVKGLGTVTLIATQEGTATLYPVTGSRVIKVTTKKLQVIRWFQDLTNTLSEGDTVRLEAEVFVMNPATGTYVKDDARTDSIRYTHPENDTVIALMGKDSLRVIGVGETTITASVPGDDYYVEAPSITMNIHVHSLSDTCKNKLLVDSKKQYTFEPSIDWGFSNLNLTQAEYGDTIRINQSEGKPDKLSFEHCGDAFNILGKEYYQGYVKAQQHIRGAWVDVPGSRIAPAKGVWNTLKDIQLDEDADAILIMREENAYGTHYVKGVKVTMLPYLRADKEFYISAEAGTTVDTTITVEYANAKAALTAKTGRKENDTLSVRTSIFYPNCGTIGTYNWPIRFSSTKVGDWMDSITIKDSGSGDSVVVYVYATVTPGAVFVYENDTTNGAWGDDGNWGHGGDLPTADDHVIILSDVIIPADTTVYVKSITIDSASTVYVNGTLIVMESTPDQENYGNIHVADNGSLDLSNIAAGGVKINNFILDASLGDTTRSSSSGQATNADKLDLHGDAYFQMTFDPSGAISYGWYDFVVPFEVNIADGIFRQGETNHLIDGTDFIVMEHSEAKRAAGQKDWTVIHGTMFPGKVYTITFDADVNQNSFLFKKKATANISGSDAFNAVCSTGDDDKRGWNGLGNGTLQHMKLKGSGKKVQLYDHGSNVYVTREADDFNFAVGTSFFMQVDGAQTIELEAITDGSKPFLAPAAEGRNTDEFRLALKAENSSRVADQLWFSACEEATEAYVIGHDLLKMGTPTDAKSAQMWTTKGGKRLCDVEATLMNDNATTPLAFYAPKAGAYTLEVERAPKDADLYLTYNDQIIWDLTMSAFEFEVLPKGVTEGYGLRIEAKKAPEIATGVDSTEAEEKAMRKVIIDNKVYIITPEGKMYDVIGKCVKY